MASNKRQPTSIGARVQLLREGQTPKMSQAALAKIMKVSRETINHWESNEREIKASQVLKLAEIFRVTCDYILRGVETHNVEFSAKTGLSENAITNLMLFNAKTMHIVTGDGKHKPTEYVEISHDKPKNHHDLIIKAMNTVMASKLLGQFWHTVALFLADEVKLKSEEEHIIGEMDGVETHFDKSLFTKGSLLHLQSVLDAVKEHKNDAFTIPGAQSVSAQNYIKSLL